MDGTPAPPGPRAPSSGDLTGKTAPAVTSSPAHHRQASDGTGVTAGQVFRWCASGAIAVLLVGLAAAGVYTMWPVLVQAIVAVFIAVSLDPLVRWVIGRGLKRPQAVALIFVVFVVVAAAVIWAAVPALVRQAGELGTDFPGYLDQLRQRSPGLAQLEARFNLQPKIDAWISELPGRLAGQAFALLGKFLGAVVSVLLITVLTIYLMLDLTRLRRGLVRLFPIRHRPQVTETIAIVVDKVGKYMIGNLVISVIAGITAFIALTVLGVPFALPLALIVALTDLIPLIGATLGAAICLTVAAATTDLWPTTALVGLFFLLYQQLENYLIAPRVIRNSVDISSIAVLFAALVGASVLGVIGAVMAIPVAATLKVIISARLRHRDEQAGETRPEPAA